MVSMARKFKVQMALDKRRVTAEQVAEKMSPLVVEGGGSREMRLPGPGLPGLGRPIDPASFSGRWSVTEGDCHVITSPWLDPSDGQGWAQIQMACALLSFSELERSPITKKTSFSVILDVSDVSPQELCEVIATFWKLEQGLLSTQPPSRSRSSSLLRKLFPDGVENCRPNEVPAGSPISLDRYLDHGELLIQYAAGTTNLPKCVTWVTLMSAILKKALIFGPPEDSARDVQDLMTWLNPRATGAQEDELADFFFSREEHFISRRVAAVRRRIHEAGNLDPDAEDNDVDEDDDDDDVVEDGD